MDRSQSCRKLATEPEKSVDMRRAFSQPLYPPQTTNNELNTAASSSNVRSSTGDMRRRIVQLNRELEQERMQIKNLRRDKAIEVRQVREEEQKKAASMQADLRSKLHKEKVNELTSLRQQLYKEKEKDILQIMRKKDENLKSSQQAWAREKDELKAKVRGEIGHEAREEAKREFERERVKLEQEISDLTRQRDMLEDTLKLVQGADKRKIDDIRRIHHEHEAELEKVKRNSWQESRKQMAEIRQLLNIIEQLEKKLGLEAGHSMRLRLEKDNLYDMLKKSTTFDAWDRMMSSSTKHETQIPPQPTTDVKGNSQELRILQRKNVELSSLVRKLDEKNQQLATRNAELLAELEKLEKGNRDKNRKLERNNADLLQTNKRLETRNKLLLDEINTLKQNKTSTGRKENTAKPRGKAEKEREELANLKAQLREQTRDIADLKQSLMEKDRRIELLRGRKKNEKRKSVGVSSQSIDSLSVPDDDAISVHSDYSDQSNDDIDSRRVKKLAKELLALERAYALLQAHVGSAVDAERDEMERQQLQSDLIQSQTRIHELERMMNNGGQGGSDGISQLQADNKALYQKLMMAEKERDQAQEELTKHSEDMRDLQDQRDLLEFELEELSQLSTAASEDWDNKRPNSSTSVDSLPATEHESSVLSFEEVKACLEELETEKKKMLSLVEQNALRQAREMLDSMAEEISHLQITESALRGKVRDLDLGYNSESLKSELHDLSSPSIVTYDQETLTDPLWVENQDVEVTHKKQRLESLESLRNTGLGVQKEDRASLTDLMLGDLVNLESVYKDYLESFPLQTAQAKAGQFELGKRDGECMTDLVWGDLEQLENTYRERLEDLWRLEENSQQTKGEVEKVDNETMTHLDLDEVDELENVCPLCRRNREVSLKVDNEAMTEIFWDDLVEQTHNEIYMSLSNELGANLRDEGETQREKSEVGVMTDLEWSELVDLENTYLECIDYVQEMESKFNVKKEDVATSTDGASSSEYECSLPFTARDIETKHCHVMTDLGYEDIVDLQHKCTDYSQKLEELQNKLAQFNIRKDEKSSITNISLQDLALLESIGEQMLKSSVKLRDAETNTDSAISDISYESLPSVVLETYPGDLETKDECDMTEGIWDEVVELQNTYRDYRQNLDEMNVKSAQFKVQKDDKESITDITMQNIAELESMYKEHLIIDNSDKNSTVSQTEKETRGCMTEMTMVVLTELEDFYIENAARDTQAPALEVEKWERESMTEITAEDIQYLEEVEELYQQREWGEDGKIETEERSVETDMTFDDIDYLQEIQAAHVECVSRENEEERSKHVEMVEIGTNTDQTIPDLEHLEELGEVYQNMAAFSKPLEPQPLMSLEREDRGVSTDLTAFDLKYLEDVEAAHEECLLDREDDELKAQLFGGDTRSKEMQSVEIMTDLALSDLKYWEDIEAAHEECLLDKEEEFRSSDFLKDMQNVEIMTDLALSDLKYWEDVEAAHEECLLDKEEECRSRDVARDMQSVEIMTDLALSDLKYLEDVEAAHEECLLDKEEECRSRDVNKDMQSVEIMTDLALSDLKYWEDVEAAHEECLLDKEEECRSRDVARDMQSVEIMTDLALSDLKYLEDVEAAHEECLLDKEEECRSRDVNKDMQSVEIMTDLALSDLKYWEDVEAAHEECLVDKEEECRSRDVNKDMQSVGIITDLTVEDLKYLEDAHEECILDKEEEEARDSTVKDQHSVGTMTDLAAFDLCRIQEITTLVSEREGKSSENEQEEKRRGSMSSSLNVLHENKNTMTELTGDILEYLKDIESTYKETLEQFEEFKSVYAVTKGHKHVTKSDKDLTTDVTVAKMTHLEETEQQPLICGSEKDHKETVTDLIQDDLEYVLEVNSSYQDLVVEKSDAEVMTDLTLSYLKQVEDEFKRLKAKEDYSGKDEKESMTDLTNFELQYLEEVECLFRERDDNKEDTETMTDLTTADLEHPEGAENQLKTLSSNRDIPTLLVPTEDKGVITDITSSDVEYLQMLLEREVSFFDSAVEKDDKSTETALTVADIRDLEDQAYTAAEVKTTPQFKEMVKEDLQVETLVDLQSELDHLPVLDEPEFIFDEEDSEEDQEKVEVGVMTDLTGFELSNPELSMKAFYQRDSTDFENRLQVSTNEMGIQCELSGVSLMKEEPGKETKNAKGIVPRFVSAVNLRSPDGGLSPVHLVVRQNDLSNAAPHELPNDSFPDDVLEQTSPLDFSVSNEHESLPLSSTWNEDACLPETGGSDEQKMESSSQDTGVQCGVADLLSMMEEYHKDTSEEDMPSWFVSAMSMTRNSTGFNPVEVVLRKLSGSSVSDDNGTERPSRGHRHSTNLTIELSRPLARSSTVTVNFPPSDSLDNEFECPEADAPLFTSVNASDNVFLETEGSIAPPTDEEEMDVLEDMPQYSAVNRFDRFLKERKDSELKNLQALRDLGESIDGTKLSKDLQEENERLKEKIKQLEDETILKELQDENELLKEQIQNENELEEENALLKERVQQLEEEANFKELEMENEILKEKLPVLEELPALKDLEEANTLLKEEVNALRKSNISDQLEEENALLQEELAASSLEIKNKNAENESLKLRIHDVEETTNQKLNELEEENELLKENIQILEETTTVEREENEELKEKIQHLEESTARAVEKLDEENSALKDKIQLLEGEAMSKAELVDSTKEQNTLLREKIQQLETSVGDQVEIEQENASLKEKIRTLESSTQYRRLSEEDLELLQLKIEQLKEAEKQIGTLNESNVALREKLDLLQFAKRNVRDNSSEMDPTEQLGKTRLLLVQDLGLTSSEVESLLGSCDLESFVSSGVNTPRAELKSLAEYFDQADRGVQAVQDVPPSVHQEMQTVPIISGAVSQGIQTNLDLITTEEPVREGPIPEHINSELQKLKDDNRELYEELMELREEAKDRERQVTEHLHLPQAHEATQTEHAQPWDQVSIEVTSPVLDAPRDAISPVPSSIEETITRILRSTAASEIGNLEERVLQFEKEPVIPTIVVGRADLENGIDGIDALVDEDKGKSESIKEDVCYLGDVISEPDNTSVGKTPKSVMDGVGTLDYLVEDEGNNKARTDTSYSIDFDLDESLPPLPESSPPPLPSGPPPDFPDASPPVLEYGVETLLLNESTPPRDAASLRASSRQRYHSSGRPSSESSRPSSRVESPVLVKENTLTLETEPSEYGTIPDDASLDSPEGQSEKPSLSDNKQDSFESRSKAGPPVLPKPKRPSISSRLPGQLSQPAASVVKPTMTSSLPTQWSRDEDGVFPPREVVRTRASSLNRGEIDALNEKIGFLERQLRNKENVIRSMKTEATELETQSLLERKDREIKILEEDNAFLKQENQKKERELLSKIGEVNKKGYETEQWKAEANNSERQRQRMEAAYLNLQNQLKTVEGADRKLAELQTKHSDAEKQNWDLSEKVKKLERTEKEFRKLEHNIQVLQTQVQGMDNLEQNRNELMDKMRVIENQRDDLLRKGRVVESERNDFLRNNKLMEMQRDESENRCALLQKTNTTLNARLDELEQDLKQAQTKMHDSQHERNYLQVQLDKMEAEKNGLQQRLATVTQERNSLENQVAELQDLSRDHVKLEDGFHTLRIKLSELTREKDDAEMQIPTLKAKVSLLKRACKEKDGLVDRLNEEIRELRHSIATSALDDLSKIRSYGYSPENFVKLSAQRDHDRERVKRHSEDLIEARLNGTTEKSPSNHESKSFQPSPPGTKKAKRFVALFDYDPYNSPTSEHPELEVKLHEGDYLTVFGDMDINGYFEADVNGVRGLVPSLYVEEVDDDDDSDLGLDDHKSKPHMSPLKKGSLYKSNGLPHKDKIAEGMVSVGPSSAGSEPRLCLVALDDYNPSRSGTVGHLAHEQVVMKKGDVMMAFGDMDVNGFYRVELNGQNGFVPGHMVEEVSSSSFLQPTSSRTPEQILGMLDNVPVRSQPQVSRDVLTPAPFSSNTYPTQALIDVVSPSYVPPHSRPLSHVGITRFQPSPEVALIGTLSHSLPSASPPRNSTQAAMVPSSRVEKTLTTYSQPLTSTHIVPVSKRPRSSKKARPSSPGVLRILRPVNHDAMLVGWTLPEMDEFGRSRGLVVKGYKIYSNGDVKLDVRSPYMAKALVEDLDLRFPIKFSIKTVAENGSSSESVSAMFSDTIKGAALDSSGESYDDSGDEKPYRTFVALYDYDPCKSSPNPNPACEMSFREGDILRVFDTTRKDGFYFGKLKNKKGLIPSNFVEEVAVASPRRLEAAKKLHASRSSPSRPFSRSSSSSEGVNSPVGTKDSAPVRRKLMVATYDYNPEEQSPQDDTDSELPFKKGQVIVIMGEMRADGFYQADIGGELGLVPASFLDEYSNTDTDSGLESGRRVSFEKGRSQRRVEDLERT